ncbi:MAG: C45 family autoproteolytic acyltransferase/hydrolase [Thermodesulfobacteriota bacterium]
MYTTCKPRMKLSALLCFLLLLCAFLCACSGSGSSAGPLVPVALFEGGRLYKVGPIPVLQLHGTHYEMGRQYGALLRAELNAAYSLMISTFSPFVSYNRMKQIAYNVYSRLEQQQKDIIAGMAETSGLGLEQQIILNALEWIPKIDRFVPHCSGFGVWGNYTGDGKLIFGRNNDDTPILYGPFGAYVVVAVFNPTGSGIPVANVNYAGVVYAATAMNRSGIFAEFNSGN